MVSVAETTRRVASRMTHQIHSLPVLALDVHTACNCRCVMCDIWTANARSREITPEELEKHIAAIARLHVQRVMLTGGEPLLHRNLWNLCARLRDSGVRVTLVTTGLLVGTFADDIAAHVDDLVISIDGPPEVHDAIRRVRGGFDRIERGLLVLANHAVRPRTTVRSVVQRMNCARLVQTVRAVRSLPVEHLSFLGADVTSAAFNRPEPWSDIRKGEVAIADDLLPLLAATIRELESQCADELRSGFLIGGSSTLWRIHDYYKALTGQASFPRIRCNAPWISAVLEPGGQVRPCFFHKPYPVEAQSLGEIINAPAAVAFRRQLDVHKDETCRRCVCTLSLAPWTSI